MSDPSFTQDLNLKYILVKTNYNNRALAKKECVDLMFDAMKNLDSYLSNMNIIEIPMPDDDSLPSEIEKIHSTYVIPSTKNVKLLYSVHSGYTWIDAEDSNNKLYKNCGDVDEIRQQLKDSGINDSGCFVFQISESTLNFKIVLLKFLICLTKIHFCGHFDVDSIYRIKYYNDVKTLVCNFDTESG